MKGVTHDFKSISGTVYLKQRIQDAMRIEKGSLPYARDYGSNLADLIDRNFDSGFEIELTTRIVGMFRNKANGLSDCKFLGLVVKGRAGKVLIDVNIYYEDQEVTLENLSYARD